ncbi:CxC2 domain-containing protein [Favolaschia claudopus]|uniref:CxC2 domain-containing protein n=1 Tax=Favolaschia claudopus TaxID=2862362 RepID=A0AAW0DG67_9AGAR
MARRRFTSVSVSRVPDSDSDEGPAPTTERMRLDSTVRVGGRTVHSSRYLDIETSPQKRRRQHTPQPDYLVPDVAAEPDFSYASADVQPPDEEDFFAFDEGHPDRPLNMWARYDQEQYLDELLRCEGRGDYEHRCRDCFTDALFCSACMVKLHADNPFHTIENRPWKSTHFSRNTLRAIGARLQLGHLRGERCPGMLKRTPEEVAADSKKTFCIVDHNGIHEVFVDFCVCGHAQSPMVQLLRARLYPATPLRPASAATFRVLRQFHKHSFESKCSPFEFYNALARETNNTGNFQPRNRYREFVCISREWRRLQLLKRFGRGHIVDGVRNIEAGACALLCPTCPQPGKNLPFGGEWRSAPHEEKFLYAGFYAVDANFRMERKQVSSEDVDPGLNEGAAFFGEVGEYMEHVKAHWDDEQQKSTCVSHDAVNQPDRESRGTASSGIGTVDCARHNMKRPNGVGDLQKGERYINMDYMLWKSLEGYDELMLIVLSYDIVCQWSINLWPRLLSYSPEFHRRAGTGYRRWMFLVPKFHLPAHIEECNIRYSFNLTPYVGQTDGEAPERGWANVNPRWGPGARRDTLDDHFNDWNHKKIIALGQLMLAASRRPWRRWWRRQEELVEMEASLPEEIVKEWTKAMQLWEADATKPNPFDAVRGRIANETRMCGGELHASEMIEMGLRLESQQRDLGSDNAVLTAHASDGQKTTLLERRNKLARKITSWIKIQSEFQPEVARLREADDRARAEAAKSQPTTGIAVESVQLWLPSKQAKTPGSAPKPSHARYEFDMREARAHEAPRGDKNVFGVAKSTRSRTTIEVLDERIRREANEYRAARSAMASLAPSLNETRWALVLRDLKPEDIRAMPRALFSDPEKRKGKKRARRDKEAAEPKEMSWIWRTGMTSLGASARQSGPRLGLGHIGGGRRVDLLEEEMRRILVFLDWKAGWWRELNGLKEGLVAYAERQAGIQEAIKQRFESDWQGCRPGAAASRERASAAMEGGSDEGEEEEDEDSADESLQPVPSASRNVAAVSVGFVANSLLPDA